MRKLWTRVSSGPGGTLHVVGRFVMTFKYAHAVGTFTKHCKCAHSLGRFCYDAVQWVLCDGAIISLYSVTIRPHTVVMPSSGTLRCDVVISPCSCEVGQSFAIGPSWRHALGLHDECRHLPLQCGDMINYCNLAMQWTVRWEYTHAVDIYIVDMYASDEVLLFCKKKVVQTSAIS